MKTFKPVTRRGGQIAKRFYYASDRVRVPDIGGNVKVGPEQRFGRLNIDKSKRESVTKMATRNEINVLHYDEVVKALTQKPDVPLEEVSRRTGLALATVRKIWDGTITRPSTVVLDRLRNPRRCPECGCRCSAWPCIVCEMERRRGDKKKGAVSFIYRHGPH